MKNKCGVVDKIESGFVTVVIERQQVVVPLEKFSEGIKEGDFVNLETFTVDKEETERKKRKVRGLLGRVLSY